MYNKAEIILPDLSYDVRLFEIQNRKSKWKWKL